MSSLHFAEVGWIHLLWAVLAFTFLLAWLERRGLEAVRTLVSPALQDRLLLRPSSTRRKLRLLFLCLCGVFMTIALMRPQWGLRFVATPRVGAEIMVCLDVSNSMLAEDVTPNRLERAKAELRDLLAYLDGDQVGLIAFAGRATVLSPLTPDFSFLRLVLDEAGPHSVARGGTRLEEPIRKAVAGFGDSAGVSRSILLITDGEDHDSFPKEAAAEAAERGIRILAIGFGDEAGSEILISDPQTGARRPLLNSNGNPVISRLDGALLRELALTTDGAYIPAGTGVLDLEAIYKRHIAKLTRGKLDGRGRTVRNDAFQVALLLALCSLLLAVSGTSGRTQSKLPSLMLAIVLVSSSLAHAADPPPGSGASSGSSSGLSSGSSNGAGSDTMQQAGERAPQAQAETAAQAAADMPDDPREAYNRGCLALDERDLDRAEGLFEHARNKSRTDAELRFRASYNLGWTESLRADGLLDDDPQGALDALARAADWFRSAIALRSGDQDARRNLEIVLRRSLELADSLRNSEQAKLLDRVDEAIKNQRDFLSSLRQAVDAAATEQRAGETEKLRQELRDLAAAELVILSDCERLSEQAGREGATISYTPEEERSPEQSARAAQLDNMLHYMHTARERMGQARAQLRRVQAQRAYRRASAALGELKRARDQLLDPVTTLDGLLGDSLELMQLSGLKAALDARPATENDENAAVGLWLTAGHLEESLGELALRVSELQQRLAAGVSRAAQMQEQGESIEKQQAQAVEQAAAAEPLLGKAVDEIGRATAAVSSSGALAALEHQRRGTDALAEAREQFLDLKRLVELLYVNQAQVVEMISPQKPDPQAGTAPGAPGVQEGDDRAAMEYAAAAAQTQERNLERAARVAGIINGESRAVEDSLAAYGDSHGQPGTGNAAAPGAGGSSEGEDREGLENQRKRLEAAAHFLLIGRAAMGSALESLQILEQSESVDKSALADARAAGGEALNHIESLRRLFFSVIEHLKDTARRQLELGDQTEEAAALASGSSEEETALRLGPLGKRQFGLATISGKIAEALNEQAQVPQDGDEDSAARMQAAAEYVLAARDGMETAAEAMTVSPPRLDSARSDQNDALEQLYEAIKLLEPPQQQEQQSDQNQQQPEQSGDQQHGDDDRETQGGQQQQQQDPGRLLQNVRDREAERREKQARKHKQGYEPVEKDW